MSNFKMPLGFSDLLMSLKAPQTVDEKIQLSVTLQATSLWQTYWERCFENKKYQAIVLKEPFEPYLKTCELWIDWVHTRKEEWEEQARKYTRFGRHIDAHKEKIKCEQLEIISKIWMREVQLKWTA